jgi:hypothetical protein
MEVLGLSNAASPYGSTPPKRQAEASPPADSTPRAAPSDAPLKSLAIEPLPKQKQVLVEPIARFSFGYTFVNPDTQEVVRKWPIEKVVTPGARVNATL